jgi:small subunit ribosomal protein S16
MDSRSPRGGKVLEELGTYDPMVRDCDARAVLNAERVTHWLSVGALPTDKVGVLIKKYGPSGTHLDKQAAALERLAQPKALPDPGAPASLPQKEEEPVAEAPPAEAPAEEAAAPAEEAAAEAAPAEEAATEEAPAAEESAEASEEKSAEKSE